MKKTAVTALLTSMIASIVGLAIWFAPTHGQPNDDQAQLVDVTVVDDNGDPVVGAPVSVQRHDGTGWVGTRRGGPSDSTGEQSIEMPTTLGRSRIVLTVPPGYTQWYDDADGSNPGRNGECAGMVARCVAYDTDAAGTVSLNQPHLDATGMSVTFHVRKVKVQPTLRVEQFDTSGDAIHGGTFTMQPYTIVTVDGKKVRQWGRVSRTGMTTAGRTFNVQPFTSYVVRWEPPENYRKVTPGAPLFGYEFTTGANGTSTTSKFTVVRTGSAVEPNSGTVDSGSSEITPSGVPVPTDPGKGRETPDPFVPDESSQETPDVGVVVEQDLTVPTETVPTETVPTETVPTETVFDLELEAELEAESGDVDAETTMVESVDHLPTEEEQYQERLDLEYGEW